MPITQPDVSKIERFERRLDALELIDWLQAIGGNLDRLVAKF